MRWRKRGGDLYERRGVSCSVVTDAYFRSGDAKIHRRNDYAIDPMHTHK